MYLTSIPTYDIMRSETGGVKMIYDYAEMKMTIPMDYFLDMFIEHYNSEALDAEYVLKDHTIPYTKDINGYDNYIIGMQNYIATLKDYDKGIYKLKTIVEDNTGDVIDMFHMENVVGFVMTINFFRIENLNFRFDFEINR